jgi:tRNA(His) 5'-end guanylyltransferase
MLVRFIIGIKIILLSNKIVMMENNIIKYRRDMELMNDLYYCGRGDVDSYINEWSNKVYWKISVCQRLKKRLEMRLLGVLGVVGAEGKNF